MLLKSIVPRLLALMLAANVQQATADDLALPDMGDTSQTALSGNDERQLGEAFMRQIRQSLHVVDDPEVSDYIQSIGQRLAAQAEGSSQPFTYFVVQDPGINAFAGPGGFIGVNSGLILATRSESELAAVMAHETAHVTQRHIARTVEATQRMTIPAAAAMLAAILLGSKSGQLGQAAVAMTAAGSVQHQLNFTRSHEEEADRVGMQFLVHAGFDPQAMASFFERLQQANRYSGDSLPAFLMDHPVTESRIAEARSRAAQYAPHQVHDSAQYALMTAKQRVLSAESPGRALEYFRQALKDSQTGGRDTARYGYALALLAREDYAGARKQAHELLAKDPDRVTYLILLARIEMESGNPRTAMKIFSDALQLYPDNHALTVYYAQSLMQAGQAGKARALLQEYVRDKESPEPELYRLLARAQGDAGFPVDGHESMAEYYYLMGQSHPAIEQLKLALRLSKDDFYRTSRVEARLRQLEKEAALEKKRGSKF